MGVRTLDRSGRAPRFRAQLSSRWLASSLVAAYVVISAVVGTVLLVAPKDPAPVGGTAAGGLPVYAYEDAVPTTPTVPGAPAPGATPQPGGSPSKVAQPNTTVPPVPAGFERVAGPGGMVTVIPAGWQVTRSTGPGAMQATDPADPTRFVRYGGSPAPATEILASHLDYEHRFSASKDGFQRLSLGTATFHGVRAVDWEFEHDSPTGRRHSHSLYWRVAGTEYFVYAASGATRWADTKPLYEAMVATVAP